jgi:glucose-6-phosphate 1-dehydrogenase
MATAAIANLEDEFNPTDKPAGPCVMVVFGAAGDLTKRKLVPALYNLAKDNLLPANFAVIGISFDDLSPEAFREQATQFLDKEDHACEEWRWFNERLYYERGDFANDVTTWRRRRTEPGVASSSRSRLDTTWNPQKH